LEGEKRKIEGGGGYGKVTLHSLQAFEEEERKRKHRTHVKMLSRGPSINDPLLQKKKKRVDGSTGPTQEKKKPPAESRTRNSSSILGEKES